MKTILFTFIIIVSNLVRAQKTPTMYINGSAILFQGDISLPYWLNSSCTISFGANSVSASILEFNIINNELVFNQAIHLTNSATIPNGKVWKLESIGIGNNSDFPNTSGFSTSQSPTVFQSPQTFTSSTTWKVPNNVTNICVEAWGKGGNGGNGNANAGSSGSGFTGGCGGGGAYSYKCVNVTPGEILTISINSDSTFIGSYISAHAGQNGQNATLNSNGLPGLGGTDSNLSSFSIAGINGSNQKGGKGGNGGNGGNVPTTINTTNYEATVGEVPGGGGGAGKNNYDGYSTNLLSGKSGGGGKVIIYF